MDRPLGAFRNVFATSCVLVEESSRNQVCSDISRAKLVHTSANAVLGSTSSEGILNILFALVARHACVGDLHDELAQARVRLLLVALVPFGKNGVSTTPETHIDIS